jgi:hypothetical protein
VSTAEHRSGAADHASGAADGGGATRPRPLGRDVAVVLLAVASHPSIWWAGLAAGGRMARTQWWRRRPFLPLPGESYWHFRLVTAFGGTGTEQAMTGRDVVAYLRWCRRTHPRRG